MPDLKSTVQDLGVKVPDPKLEVPDLRSGGIRLVRTVFCGVDTALNAAEVSVALERLTAKQKRRQYSATKVSSEVLTSVSTTHCSAADDSDNTSSQPPKPRRIQSAHVWARQRSAAATRRDKEDFEDSEHAGRNSENARPGSEHIRQRMRRSSGTSRRTDDATEAGYFDSQRNMIEQSRALLEQSKAKHHALVAQAHSMQKRLRTHEFSETEGQTSLTPKPPSASPADKKPTSTFRTQRLARYNISVHFNDCTSLSHMDLVQLFTECQIVAAYWSKGHGPVTDH